MKERKYIVKSQNNILKSLINDGGYAKNKAKSLLKYDNVLVNGNLVNKFDCLVSENDIITVTNYRKVNTPFQIIYEDSEFLVINKKAKLLTASSDINENSLYKVASKYLSLKLSKEKLYVLHRLDRDTSGIVVFTKDKKLTDMLQNDWNKYAKKRIYMGVVEGVLEKKQDTITCYLKDDEEMTKVVNSEKYGKKSVTKYKVIKENKDNSLLEIELLTGRKNQIRAVFASLGHSIIGDKKYYSDINPLHRLALVHTLIELEHPITHKIYKFEVNTPKEFYNLVK